MKIDHLLYAVAAIVMTSCSSTFEEPDSIDLQLAMTAPMSRSVADTIEEEPELFVPTLEMLSLKETYEKLHASSSMLYASTY